MHVLIVTCVFPPEPMVSAQTSAQIAQALAEKGHRLTVVTPFPNRPAGVLYPGYTCRLYQRQRLPQDVDLVRCFSILSPDSSMISRFFENLSFGVTAGWAALTCHRPDVIYANTWPILATGILFLVSRLRRVPLVISVQDVYPESLVVQERIRANSLAARLMRWLDGIVARGAHAVLVISRRFAAIYRDQRRVIPQRLHVIPNWIDSSLISLDDRSDRFRHQAGIPDKAFVVAYGGNIGVAAGVETVVSAFQYLQDAQGLHLLVAGQGSRLAACRWLARELAAERTVFYSPWPAQETSLLLRSADVLVLPTRGRQSLASVPSKLISYMLAARPVIALALPGSDIAEIVGQAGCGWIVPPDRPDLLADQIKKVMGMETRELCHRGQAGRTFALEHLTRETCLPQVIDVLEACAGQECHC